MKDVLSAFGSEVFRPLVTLVLPGAVTITPYFIALIQRWPGFYLLAAANHTEAAFVLLFAALFLGLVIEDIGARIETEFDELAKKNSDFEEIWFSYLTYTFEREPPGRNYVRALVIRLKFELGSGIALLLAIPGVFLVVLPYPAADWWISAVLVLLSGYLGFFEARATHGTLAKVRKQLVKDSLKSESAAK
jgi:hypothetical protein